MESSGQQEFICLPPVIDGSVVTLRYEGLDAGGTRTTFRETIVIPGPLEQVPGHLLTPVLKLLSLAASLSYFKAYAPAKFCVPAGLTAAHRDFLRALITNGLGEFAYRNRLAQVFNTVIEAPDLPAENAVGASPAGNPSAPVGAAAPSKALVAVGGGKDSIVSIEALKGAGIGVELFSVNRFEAIDRTAQVAGLPLRVVEREIDRELFELNKRGAPNGHVPVTAVNSLLAVMTAMSRGLDTVVFSNEASSSYGNFQWEGQEINHQWSKGAEFEALLRANLPAGSPEYVSLLRPLYEIRIARRFASHEQYHGVFTSCNRAFKIEAEDRRSWCADCPKCRFVFLCLAPFMAREDLLAIFGGRDMFADPAQDTGFLELLAAGGHVKPFECVGQPDECRAAFALLGQHPQWEGHDVFKRLGIGEILAGRDYSAVFAFDEAGHHLPPSLEEVAREI